jgi:hypothetical protein
MSLIFKLLGLSTILKLELQDVGAKEEEEEGEGALVAGAWGAAEATEEGWAFLEV